MDLFETGEDWLKKKGKKSEKTTTKSDGFDEDVFETQIGPMNWATFNGKMNRTALDSPAEPIQELLFFTFNDRWTTPNTEPRRERMMCL
jgi:hypothetical protein